MNEKQLVRKQIAEKLGYFEAWCPAEEVGMVGDAIVGIFAPDGEFTNNFIVPDSSYIEGDQYEELWDLCATIPNWPEKDSDVLDLWRELLAEMSEMTHVELVIRSGRVTLVEKDWGGYEKEWWQEGNSALSLSLLALEIM